MTVQRWQRYWVLILISVGCGMMTGFSKAGELPAGWQIDCVGRMQIGVPGEADLAAFPSDDFQKYVPGKQGARFQDGQRIFDSELSFMGLIVVSHPVDDVARKRFLQTAEKKKADDEKTLKERHGVSVFGYPANL